MGDLNRLNVSYQHRGLRFFLWLTVCAAVLIAWNPISEAQLSPSHQAISLSDQEQALADALLKAINNEDVTRVETLLRFGVDINALSGPLKITPLIQACQLNDIDTIHLLLSYGADVNQTAAMTSPLEQAILNGNDALVTLLLDYGADANQRLSVRRTPLMVAAQEGDGVIVRTLVEYGANLNDQDFAGRTPLMFAVEYQHSQIVSFFLSQGADQDIQDITLSTVRHLAESKGDQQLIELLDTFR
jgi:ankyrin repeat protein